MRIGEFAQKHNVTQDTIRYYLDIGLLVTKKNRGQYKFTDADSRDLERIIELKKLEFSLTEIQKILIFQRISGTNTETFQNLYLPCLEKKQDEITKEITRYSKMNEFLNDKINKIKTQKLKPGKKLGFPMNSLNILACPICESSLKLSGGTIEENMIIDADIQCECGYKAVIEDGIYIDETTVRTKLLNGKKMPTKEEYLANCSYTYVNFLYKGMATLIEYINRYKKEPEYIMELDNCVGFFLLQYIKYIPKDSTYILIDYDKERIVDLKRNLEMYYEHTNFIFLCCDYDKLPIKKASIDILVDFLMTRKYAKTNNEFLPKVVLPFLQEKGIFTSSYFYSQESRKDLLDLPSNLKDYHNKDRMLEKFKLFNLNKIETKDIGPIAKDGSYNSILKDSELYQSCYIGRRIPPS